MKKELVKSSSIMCYARGGEPPRTKDGFFRHGDKFVWVCPTGVTFVFEDLEVMQSLNKLVGYPEPDWANLPTWEGGEL